MKFNEAQIIELVKKAHLTPPKWVATAREKNVVLEAIINGKDFADQLERIEHKEDEKQLQARRKYSRSIKDLFERVLRPIDNVYTATGGSKRFADNISEAGKEKLFKKVANMRDGKPLEKWLQRNWMPLYHTDPNGVIFYEWLNDNFYPTYKNIGKIRDYEANGQNLEWILFEPVLKPDGANYWRFVDDAKDYIIKQTGDYFEIKEDETFDNPFGFCPGIIMSDIIKIGTKVRLSPVESVIELAKESLRDNSQKSIFKFMLWSPIFWRYAQKCPTCGGSKRTGEETCKMCNGTGIYGSKDITDVIQIATPEDKESAIITPNIAGFIVPDIEIMAEFNKEIELLEDRIYTTIWGTSNYQKMYSSTREVDKTATEIIYDTAPQIARLNDYADVAQWVEGAMTELAANFIITEKKKDESVVTIIYGRNYIIEPIEVLLARYEASKAAGSNTSILDRELEEWIFSKFKTDPMGLEEELKRVKVEPFIHYTVEQVYSNYGQKEAKQKMLFEKWWRNEADKSKDAAILITEFETYCSEKIEEPETEQKEIETDTEVDPEKE